MRLWKQSSHGSSSPEPVGKLTADSSFWDVNISVKKEDALIIPLPRYVNLFGTPTKTVLMCLLSHHPFICATKLWWKRAPEGGFVKARSGSCSLWWIGVIELLSLWRLASSSSFYPVQKTACGSRAFGLGMSRGRCIRQKNRRNTSISGQTWLLKLWLGARRSCGTGSLIGAHSWGQGHVRSRHIPGRRQCVLLIFRKFCHSLFTFISLHIPDL